MVGQGSVLWYYAFPTFITLFVMMGYKKKGMAYVIFFILLFFSMFRGDYVGTDTFRYMDDNAISYKVLTFGFHFDLEHFLDDLGKSTEIISTSIFALVYYGFFPNRFVIYAFSLITMIFLFLSLKRFRVNCSIGLLMYVFLVFYYFSLTACRQMAAASIVLYAMSYLGEKGKKKYFFFAYMITATLIHSSAIFYVWIYALSFISFDRKITLLFLAIFCVVFSLIEFNVMNMVYQYVNLDYVQDYRGQYEIGERSILGRIFDLMRFAFLLYLFSIRNNEKRTDLYDNLFVISILLMALFSQVNALLGRVIYNITIFLCVYISMVLVDKKQLKQLSGKLIFLFFAIISIYVIGAYGPISLGSGYYLMF